MEIVKHKSYGCLKIWGEGYLKRLQISKGKNIRTDLLLIAEGLQFLGVQQQVVIEKKLRALLTVMRDRKNREQAHG